jgi:hypothetical protein
MGLVRALKGIRLDRGTGDNQMQLNLWWGKLQALELKISHATIFDWATDFL